MNKVKILIIEDEPEYQISLKEIYKEIFDGNTEIGFASTDTDAILSIEEHEGENKYDLISLDLMLKPKNLEVYSGIECTTLIRRIHECSSCVGLVVISGITQIDSSNAEFNSLQVDITNVIKEYFPNNSKFFNKIASVEATKKTILKSKEEIKKLINKKYDPLNDYAFFQKGEIWTIKSKMKETQLSNYDGLRYIHRLLELEDTPFTDQYPNGISSVELYNSFTRCPNTAKRNNELMKGGKDHQNNGQDRAANLELFQAKNDLSSDEMFDLKKNIKHSENELKLIDREIWYLKQKEKEPQLTLNRYQKLIDKAGLFAEIIQKYIEIHSVRKTKKISDEIAQYKIKFVMAVNEMELLISENTTLNTKILEEFNKFIQNRKYLISTPVDRTSEEKVVQNVSKAIDIALEKIKKEGLDDLYNYFKHVIKKGSYCRIKKSNVYPKIIFELYP